MPAGVQLRELRSQVRAEAGHSTNVAHGQMSQETLDQLIRRVQEEMFMAYDWPNLVINRSVDIYAGQKDYTLPNELSFEYVNDAWVKSGVNFYKLEYGITFDLYNVYSQTAQSNPIQRWQLSGDLADFNSGKFEVWPVPSQDMQAWFRGRRQLAPLMLDSDRCTLDSTVIVLMAAGELLARQKSDDAQIKIEKAAQLLRHMKARQSSSKQSPYVLNGGLRQPRLRPGIDYMPDA